MVYLLRVWIICSMFYFVVLIIITLLCSGELRLSMPVILLTSLILGGFIAIRVSEI